MAKTKSKFLLLWEDKKGKHHQADAMKAIPSICLDMEASLEKYRTITIKKS
jgi:hypothetical protein